MIEQGNLQANLAALDAERAVLGALLYDTGTHHAVNLLSGDDFASPAHRAIYQAIGDVMANGSCPDLVTVDEALSNSGLLEGIGGTPYLVELTQGVPTTANTLSYVDIVRAQANRRRAHEAVQAAEARIVGGMDDLDSILLDLTEETRKLVGAKRRWVDMMDVLLMTNDMVERRMRGEETRLRTGIASMDNGFYGLVPGELTVIGARPSEGKSALGVSIVTRATLDGFRGGVISLEMSAEQYGMRILASLSGVPLTKIRDGAMSPEEYELYAKAIGPASAIDIRYSFEANTIEAICALAQQMVDQAGISLLMIDHLHLMRSSKSSKSEYELLTYLTRTLKGLALRLNIPVVLLAQLSRGGASRADKRPVLTDLRGSGSIEQDADNIILLHRCDNENADWLEPIDRERIHWLAQTEGLLMLLRVLKQRQGETFDCFAAFHPAKMRFTHIDRREDTE